jgi:hypothetical protein
MDYKALIEARVMRDAERIAVDIFHRRNVGGIVLAELCDEILSIVEREIASFNKPTSRTKVFNGQIKVARPSQGNSDKGSQPYARRGSP